MNEHVTTNGHRNPNTGSEGASRTQSNSGFKEVECESSNASQLGTGAEFPERRDAATALADPVPRGLVFDHAGQSVTTSLAVAEGTGNDHASVIKLVRTHRADFEDFGPIGFEIQLANTPQGGGRPTEYALLNEHQATLLITFMKNSPVVKDFKKRLVKAFWDLAKAATAARDPMLVLNDPVALRSLLSSYSEKVLALEESNRVLEPKAAALDRLATATEGSLCITDTAKALHVQPKALFKWLAMNGWIYRRPGGKSWLGYQARQQNGFLEHKMMAYTTAEGGERVREQVLITLKGLTMLSRAVVAGHIVREEGGAS